MAHGAALGHRLTETVNGHTLFLHDGRARPSPRPFLARRRGPASRDKFAKLSKEDRERLIAFVSSL
jgi:CxxC motif-containing protein (DUF1111 family)